MLVRIGDVNRIDLVKYALQAHGYWRNKGLAADLVILNEDFSGYRAVLQDQIMGLINAGPEALVVDRSGGVFVRRAEELSEEDRVLFQTVARVVLTGTIETLAEQVQRRVAAERLPVPLEPSRLPHPRPSSPCRQRESSFHNGLGGFTADGREYVITLEPGQSTPAPWANVIASPHIGTVVSEKGGAYTWVENAHEFRLTTFHNDPVSDSSGEAFYLRDDETGAFWSPTPLALPGTVRLRMPARLRLQRVRALRIGHLLGAVDLCGHGCAREVRHRQAAQPVGAFQAALAHGLLGAGARRMETRQPHAHRDGEGSGHRRTLRPEPILPLTARPDRLRAGERTETYRHREPRRVHRTQRLAGRPGRAAPHAVVGQDRRGARSLRRGPYRPRSLADGQEREIVFIVGAADDADEARRLVLRFGGPAGARQALEEVWAHWNRVLGAVYLETPDRALDVLANGWLIYQTLSSRFWGRSGYYQSGGAYGFRDQLQDTMALLYSRPLAHARASAALRGAPVPRG